MGSLVSRLALEDKQINVVAAVDVNKIGNELGSLVGVEDPNKIKISDAKKLQQIINDTKPDVAVDFSWGLRGSGQHDADHVARIHADRSAT